MCICRVMYIYFFFFKQKTAYEMRISDWSSDVCSSDLLPGRPGDRLLDAGRDRIVQALSRPLLLDAAPGLSDRDRGGRRRGAHGEQIGRASCRERVCQYV